MKASRIASWAFESIAATLAAYSLCILAWMLWQVANEIAGPNLGAGPNGMPGNLGSGIGLAIWIGSGLIAALIAYPVALAALPDDKSTPAWRFGRFVQGASIVGFIAPIILFVIALVFE
jgi:hypothetical protein